MTSKYDGDVDWVLITWLYGIFGLFMASVYGLVTHESIPELSDNTLIARTILTGVFWPIALVIFLIMGIIWVVSNAFFV